MGPLLSAHKYLSALGSSSLAVRPVEAAILSSTAKPKAPTHALSATVVIAFESEVPLVELFFSVESGKPLCETPVYDAAIALTIVEPL